MKISPNTKVIAKALNGAKAVYSIEKHPGLHLSANGEGGGAWRIKYRPSPGATQRWFTITTDARNAKFDEVVNRASQLLTDIRVNGVDPHSVREAAQAIVVTESRTFESAYDAWMARPNKKTPRPRSIEARTAQMKHLRPHIGSTPISVLTKEKLRSVLEKIRIATTDVERGFRGYSATKCHGLLKSVCKYAVEQEYIDRDPTRGLDLPVPNENPDGKQNRAPTDSELKAIWNAAPDHMNRQHVAMLQLALLIGKRVSEIGGAHRDEFDLTSDRPWMRIPADREGNKSREEEIVPLPPLAASILRKHIKASQESAFMFPARGYKDVPTQRGALSSSFRRVREATGTPDAVRFHDARGLISDQMAKMGVPSEYRSHILHHTGDTRASLANSVYSTFDYEPEKRRALELWERRLLAIVEGRPLPTERWTA